VFRLKGGKNLKVIRIEGIKEDSAMIQSTLEEFLCDNPVFIINKDKELYKFIEELQIDDNFLYVLKVAREIEFNIFPVELKDKTSDRTIKRNIPSLSSLLEEVEEDQAPFLQLIVDTEDKNVVGNIIQALIYLNINLEVMMLKEKRDREVVNAFKQKFYRIKNSILDAKYAVKAIKVAEELEKDKETVLNILHDIEVDLDKAKERDLNIAVMATKKAGKSVVVNSFLDEQYAPTSFELPTPNTCIYKKSIDNRIRLVYNGEQSYFSSPEEIYKYTYDEFKRAQNDAECACTIDDMEIHYVNNRNDFAAFTVVDTPGPNYAGANSSQSGENMHKKSAYKWIEKSDVVLFLVNYSNYLSSDEEQFFRDIKSEFEKYDKFYSLIVVVNKLDEMYMSECENKSVVRFLDYIRCKLNDLGYKGFVVLGTSARTYFDATKVSRIDSTVLKDLGEKASIEQLSGDDLRGRLKKLKRKFIGKSNMTILSFVDDQLEKLECFHGLEDASLSTLKIKSGIPKLKEYTTYVAIQKANTELYASLIRSIDEKFVRIRNMDIIKNLIDSKAEKQDQIQEFESMLHDMMSSIETIDNEINHKLSFNSLQDELIKEIRESRNSRIEAVSQVYADRINEFFMKLKYRDSSELGELKSIGINIDFSIDNKAIEEEFDSIISSFLSRANSELDEKERHFKEFDARIKELVNIFSEKIKKEYDFKNFIIEVPKIEHAFSRRSLVRIPKISLDNIVATDKVLETIEFKQNILEKFISNLTDKKIGTYTMDSESLRDVRKSWLQLIRKGIEGEYVASYSVLEGNFLSSINELKIQIEKSADNLTSTYKDIFSDILKDLSTSKLNAEEQMKYLDAKLEFLDRIEERMEEFTEIWSEVRMNTI
jgi:hypothetical protein